MKQTDENQITGKENCVLKLSKAIYELYINQDTVGIMI